MPFISFAQNFEDIMLWRALGHVQNGFYIDVGAAWPTDDSVTKAFYDRGWHGINIEPTPQLYKRLCQERLKDINLQLAISDQPGAMQMSFISDTGLSTLHHEIADQHSQEGRQVEMETVTVTTLNDIVQNFVAQDQPIHFLKVDVEGHEAAVLKSLDWLKVRPWIVLVEATLPMSQVESYAHWEPILVSSGYFFVYADGINRFYVAQEHSELFAAFRCPPNVFDGFILVNQRRMAQERTEQAELLAQQAWQEVERARSSESLAHGLVNQLQNQNNALEHQLLSVYLSNSWKMTAPLRWYKLQIRRLKQEGLLSRLRALNFKMALILRGVFSSSAKGNTQQAFETISELTPRAMQICEKLQQGQEQKKNQDL